jgi:hypothetical protein
MATLNFFSDNDLHATLIRTDTATESLHFFIVQQAQIGSGSKLQMDNLVMEMMARVLGNVTDYTPDPNIHVRLKKNHLVTIERAKEYVYALCKAFFDVYRCYWTPFFMRMFSLSLKTSATVKSRDILPTLVCALYVAGDCIPYRLMIKSTLIGR